MLDAIRTKYGFRHMIGAGLATVFGFLIRPARKECNRHGLHCSQAVSLAYRSVGFDPWLGGPDWATTPRHLADSTIFEKVGRLEI